MKNKTLTQSFTNAFYVLTYMTLWATWKTKKQLLTATFLIILVMSMPKLVAYAPYANASEFPYVEKPTTERERITNYIYEVFGKDAQKALMIAKCESGLRPNAVNDNTTWGGVSKDLGVFQINQHYQGVTNSKFLFDWKINTLMAKQIFDSRGNWSAWTCARNLGL